MTKSIGVVGCGGFVGGACYYAFNQSKYHDVYGYDIEPSKTKNTKKETFNASLIFVAVPTPMDENGKCHLGIVESVIKEIREGPYSNEFIIIKSTVPPGTTRALNEKYGNVLFSPEFLTERRYIQDFVELPYQIVGAENAGHQGFMLREFYFNLMTQGILQAGEVYRMASEQAEMVKYIRNCYLAVRLSYFNEIKQVCDTIGIDYQEAKTFAGLDDRVGQHYNIVTDENPGWGLSCLPKDLNAMMHLAKNVGIKPLMLEAAWKKNVEVRKDKDWEKLEKALLKVEESDDQ